MGFFLWCISVQRQWFACSRLVGTLLIYFSISVGCSPCSHCLLVHSVQGRAMFSHSLYMFTYSWFSGTPSVWVGLIKSRCSRPLSMDRFYSFSFSVLAVQLSVQSSSAHGIFSRARPFCPLSSSMTPFAQVHAHQVFTNSVTKPQSLSLMARQLIALSVPLIRSIDHMFSRRFQPSSSISTHVHVSYGFPTG